LPTKNRRFASAPISLDKKSWQTQGGGFLVWEVNMVPENEMGVVVLFAQKAEVAGFELLSIGSSFPDALVQKDGKRYRVEFEYASSNFVVHKHDPRGCDLIVCWRHDFDDSILPVLALSNADWPDTSLDLPSEMERGLAYWKQRALLAEKRLNAYREKFDEAAKLENPGTFECPGCDRVFGTVQALNAHSRFCEGNPELNSNGREATQEREEQET
jgi:hypothetical protein